MSRELFGVELGHRVYDENGDVIFAVIGGTTVPDGVSGQQGNVPVGSLYVRAGTAELYQKIANAGNAADYQLNGASAAVIGLWRSEAVVALTDEVQGAGTRDMAVNPFTDDDGTALPVSTFVVGKYVITGANGSPVLLEITNVAGDDVTFAAAGTALSQDDTFFVQNYLPDADGLENAAIVNFNGSIMIKVADVDWNFADGINLAAAYASQNGTITSADSVNSAVEKLDGNQQDIQAASGLAQGDTDYGIFTGQTIPDGSTSKAALQSLETALEAIRTDGGPADIAQATPTVVDSVLADECQRAEWEVTAHDIGTPANIWTFQVSGFHNGHAGADATTVKDKVYDKDRIGGNFNLDASVTLTGVGAAQAMNLVLETSDADGIRYTVSRIGCTKAL